MWARAGLEPAPTGNLEGYPIQPTWEVIGTRVAETATPTAFIGSNPKPETRAAKRGRPYGVDWRQSETCNAGRCGQRPVRRGLNAICTVGAGSKPARQLPPLGELARPQAMTEGVSQSSPNPRYVRKTTSMVSKSKYSATLTSRCSMRPPRRRTDWVGERGTEARPGMGVPSA